MPICQSLNQSNQILVSPTVYNIQVLCQTAAAVKYSRNAADDNKFDPSLTQSSN